MMKIHWVALAVTVTLAAGTAASYAATTTYTDVNNNWAKSDINNMVNRNVMTGFNDGMFHPDAWVTRSEFTAMAAKTLSLPQQQTDMVPSFKNVSQNYWGFQTVDNQNWISAYPSGVFRPTNPVRRVEVLAGLAGALNKPLVSDAEATQILSKYSDAAEVPANVRREVATSIKYNLFEIDPKSGQNMIEPLRPATRAEVAAMLNDLYDKRDIAIVQNGQLVAQGENQQTMTSSSMQTTPETTTSGTSMVRTSESTSSSTTEQGSSTMTSQGMGEGTTTGEQQGAYGTTTTTGETTAQATEAIGGGEKSHIDFSQTQGTPFHNFIEGRGRTPYRNSADSIPAFRSVNTSVAPSDVTASEPMSLAPNTTFTGTVAKAFYSSYNHPGDPVMVVVDHPIYDSNGRVIAPAGTQVLGVITSVLSRNDSGVENAQVGMNFNGFITPAGQQIPISAKINNTDGILKANDLQGVVFHPNRSTEALKREIGASEGSLYGTKIGKAEVLEQPLVDQVSDRPVDPMDIEPKDVVVGVGDRLQLRLDEIGAVEQNTTTTTTPAQPVNACPPTKRGLFHRHQNSNPTNTTPSGDNTTQ